MQGISIAPAVQGTSASSASTNGVASADDAGGEVGSAAGLFGAILAGQMKGKVAIKGGGDVALVGNTKAETGKEKDKAGIDIASAALSDLLAAAGINVVPTQIVAGQQPMIAEGKRDGNGALLNAEGKNGGVLSLSAANDPVMMAGKGATEDAKRLGAEEDGRTSGVEEFAGNGKIVPVLEKVVGEAELKGAMDGKSDSFAAKLEAAAGGESQASAAMPLALPVTQSASNQVPSTPVGVMEIAVPVGSAGWGEALGDKVVWMNGQGSQVAELRLDPPHLGPMEVRLTMVNDQATAVFVSHNPAVREAIESAMPRLREMLADSGIMLGNTMVGAESFQQQQQAFSQGSGNGNNAGTAENGIQEIPVLGDAGQTSMGATIVKGLVDMFV